MKQKRLFLTIAFLMGVILLYAQNSDEKYTANITGASVLVLDYMLRPGDIDTHSFDRENNLGVFYPDEDGVIRIELPNGYYQYLAKRKGRQPENGSFYISNRNVYFEIRMLPPFCGLDTRKIVNDAYYLLHNKKRRRRESCYIQHLRVEMLKPCMDMLACVITELEAKRTKIMLTIT